MVEGIFAGLLGMKRFLFSKRMSRVVAFVLPGLMMTRRTFSLSRRSRSLVIACLAGFTCLIACPFTATAAQNQLAESRLEHPLNTVTTLPVLPFITNQGQLDDDIAYYTRASSVGMAVTIAGELVLIMPPNEAGEDAKLTIIKESFSNEPLTVTALQPVETRINSYTGKDPALWLENIPAYKVVSLGEIAKGIELELHADGVNVQKFFHVRSGAKPRDIRITVEGATNLSLDDEGRLVMATSDGPLRFTRPLAYQFIDGKKQPVESAYALDKHSYGFVVGDYDSSKDLIIDPLLASTYLGGGNYDSIVKLATDEKGDVLLTGVTESNDLFNIVSDEYKGYQDIFVARFRADLTGYLGFTYIGGQYGEAPEDMALGLDNDGKVKNIYIAGWTHSPDIPATGYDSSHNGGDDGFVAQLDPNGLQLLASTYLGSTGYAIDRAESVALDSGGNVYVAGHGGLGLPIVPGTTPYDDSYNYGGGDAFAARFSPDLGDLEVLTYLGGGNSDLAYGIALTDSGTVYLAGNTNSTDFPICGTRKDKDVFIAKMSWGLTKLEHAICFGGDFDENVRDMILVENSNIIIVGETQSDDLPQPVSNTFSGNILHDAFVARFRSDLTQASAIYLGGSYHDYAYGVAADPIAGVFVTGWTYSPDFPVSADAYSTQMTSSTAEAFIARLPLDLSSIARATYLGGESVDEGRCLALDRNGNVLVGGITQSIDFPTTLTAFDGTYNHHDAFIAKLTPDLSSKSVYLEPTNYDFGGAFVAIEKLSAFFTLRNVSDLNATISSISVTDNTNFGYNIDCDGCCSGVVQANNSCKIEAFYQPQSTGKHSSLLIVTGEGLDAYRLSATLQGTGLVGLDEGGDGVTCFIATAAYGSNLHEDVQVLRDLRDEHLLTNSPGRKFVAAYYKYSPPVADFIRTDETRRMLARWLLTPLVYSVKHPFLALLLVSGTLIMIVGYRKRRRFRRFNH